MKHFNNFSPPVSTKNEICGGNINIILAPQSVLTSKNRTNFISLISSELDHLVVA